MVVLFFWKIFVMGDINNSNQASNKKNNLRKYKIEKCHENLIIFKWLNFLLNFTLKIRSTGKQILKIKRAHNI